MRVVGVTRIQDEADIVEAFVRHHATLLDLHILLDGGSTDATLDILRALRAEGLAVQVYQTQTPVFVESLLNTGLYRLALKEGADWVIFLDTDEFLAVRGADRPAEVLAIAPPGVPCLRLLAYRYMPPITGLVRREARPQMPKIAARRLEPARITIYAGNHGAYVDGAYDAGLSQDRLFLAHVPDRDPLQIARRAILARMRAIASGQAIGDDASQHCAPAVDALKRDPRAWLAQAMAEPDGLVEDPVPYRGGPLVHTPEPDELARLLMILAARTEALARSHGRILDRKRLIKKEMMDDARRVVRLF
ncbi:MAG: glycosyltransferase family 2 protein [Acidisphaera sp.]|nr:glycosyltransferase family 2 protein [Acidisphaera sp.]